MQQSKKENFTIDVNWKSTAGANQNQIVVNVKFIIVELRKKMRENKKLATCWKWQDFDLSRLFLDFFSAKSFDHDFVSFHSSFDEIIDFNDHQSV